MTTVWWKIMILQVLMTTVMHSNANEIESDAITALEMLFTDKEIIWYFNKLLIEVNIILNTLLVII